MRSETRCLQELEELKKDLAFWRRRLEGTPDGPERKILAATISGLEGQMEALHWVLKGD
jgi:hypothetical protein